MRFVPARCTHCNAPLEVDTWKKSAVCHHCGTPYVIEEAVNNFHFNFSGQHRDDSASTPVLTKDMQMKLEAAEAHLRLGKYELALTTFEALSEEIPQVYRVWWGQILAMTKMLTEPICDREELKKLTDLYDSMMLFVPPKKREAIGKRFMEYYESQEQLTVQRKSELQARAEQLREALAGLEECVEECRKPVHLRSDQIPSLRAVVLAFLVVLALLARSPLLIILLLLGFVAYVEVAEPLLVQQAEEWEEKVQTAIDEFTERSQAIADELSQIEEQLGKLSD